MNENDPDKKNYGERSPYITLNSIKDVFLGNRWNADNHVGGSTTTEIIKIIRSFEVFLGLAIITLTFDSTVVFYSLYSFLEGSRSYMHNETFLAMLFIIMAFKVYLFAESVTQLKNKKRLELLEELIFNAAPDPDLEIVKRKVGPIAHFLIKRFKSKNGLN